MLPASIAIAIAHSSIPNIFHIPLRYWSCDASVAASRDAMQSCQNVWSTRLRYCSGAVTIGVFLECFEVTRDLICYVRGTEHAKEAPKWFALVAAVGLVLVIIGVGGEWYCEGKQASADTVIQRYDEQILANAESDAAQAKARVAPLELEAACAREETAQLQKDTEGLKKSALEDKLELTRLTGPIQVVRVINGVAKPDPMKGTKQRIVLRSNTVVVLPKLPKGKALDWTLFLTQDDSGQRQFGTIPKVMPGGEPQSPFGNPLVFSPRTTCTMELTSDEHGTIDNTWGGANCPNIPIKK